VKVAILYNQFFDYDGQEMRIGGVETYLLNLARLSIEMGMEPTIYQWSNRPFGHIVEGFFVRGVPVCHLPFGKRHRALHDAATRDLDENRDIVIFGADHKTIATSNPRHISIQHGVAWDLPVEYLTHRWISRYGWAAGVIKWRTVRSCRRNFENCPNVVCVDYNFMNWYRTTLAREPQGRRIWVIPNFAPVAPESIVRERRFESNRVRVLFARRFVPFRGTRIFAEAVGRLLSEYEGLSVTFAGEGPDESWLRERFRTETRVAFKRYLPDQTMDIHLQHDIAVVPSLASEGTSLSVAEAMATGCSVVATAVGGITNMILDGYNGVLVMPNAVSLGRGLEGLLRDPDLCQRLGARAYETAANAFSVERWKRSWHSVLEEVGQLSG
jgi:glycosyltransferase involved in cell wall biosynthesis